MITENLGKIAITPKGQWVAGTYERLDMVTDAGSSYLSLKDNNVSALNTADWMLVAEKGDAFEYSDFTPEQLEALKVKGDKGDPFLYSDFTPAQIAELQQPAADTIASIVAVELAVEQAEALRVQAEIDRETNTGTAIQNAETATQNASDAAILANEKAGLADTAAGLANTATSNADTAATNADTKAGLADTAATNANNVANGYAAELALKANKVQEEWITPTLLNGWVNDANLKIQYYKDNFGIVRMRGTASGGTFASTVFTFPVGYRPMKSYSANTSSGLGSNGHINILSSGVVWFRAGATNNVDNITFKAEQ